MGKKIERKKNSRSTYSSGGVSFEAQFRVPEMGPLLRKFLAQEK